MVFLAEIDVADFAKKREFILCMEKSVNLKLLVSVYVILATIQRRGGRLALSG